MEKVMKRQADKSVYDLCIEFGFEIDHHESDLYIKDCQAARTLLNQRGQQYTCFTSQIDGHVWLDVPFAYMPFWTNAAAMRNLDNELQDS